MTRKQGKYGIIQSDDTTSCDHTTDAARCPDCLNDIIDEIGNQLDMSNQLVDDLLEELDRVETLHTTVEVLRQRLATGLQDPTTRKASTLMLLMLKDVFAAADDCTSMFIPPPAKNDNSN
jgi:hypothetical protein